MGSPEYNFIRDFFNRGLPATPTVEGVIDSIPNAQKRIADLERKVTALLVSQEKTVKWVTYFRKEYTFTKASLAIKDKDAADLRSDLDRIINAQNWMSIQTIGGRIDSGSAVQYCPQPANTTGTPAILIGPGSTFCSTPAVHVPGRRPGKEPITPISFDLDGVSNSSDDEMPDLQQLPTGISKMADLVDNSLPTPLAEPLQGYAPVHASEPQALVGRMLQNS